MKPKTMIAKRKDEPKKVYFMAAVLAIYERDGAQKQRHLNVILEQDYPPVNKESLGKIQQGAIARLVAETALETSQIKDIVILGISLLGMMTPNEFNGLEPTTSAPH